MTPDGKPLHLPRASADGAQLNLDALYHIMPSAFTEAADPKTGEVRRMVDFDALRELLGDCAVTGDDGEMYQFTWPGKRAAKAEAARPTDKTLRPVPEDSLDWDNTHNVYIEDDVVVYSKLPNGFYINTPMGKYNPDWAVAFREGSVKHVYFVAETKGNDIEASQLRRSEDAKIECARRHFAAISTGDVVYSVVRTYRDLYNAVMN